MKPFLGVILLVTGCAQIQAQRGPSWLRAKSGWTADRIVCLGHSGADGGVRDADWAAARCTAGYAQAWLKPAIDAHVKEEARRKRTFIALARLAKITKRYEHPASGEVTSRMELTQDEVDRQAQREFMDEQELLGGLRAKVGVGLAAGTKTVAVDPIWLKTNWSKIEQAAALPEKVRAELVAQEAAKKAKEKSSKKPNQEVGAKKSAAKPVKTVTKATGPKADKPSANPAKKSDVPTKPSAAGKALAAPKKSTTKPKAETKKPPAVKSPKNKVKAAKESKKPPVEAAPKATKKEPS